MIYIIKRDGRKVQFNKRKIENAICKCFTAVDGELNDYGESKSISIANYIESKVNEDSSKEFTVEEIQDMVENGLMNTKRKDVARAYIKYRNERTKIRGNSTDSSIDEIASGKKGYWSSENSNKRFRSVTTQRDYFAGAVSEDYSKRMLLSEDIVSAHEEGIIHFHDIDYFAQNALSNCSLVNLEDMLQNGTVVNEKMIEKPHKFLTASTIATQIILGVSSSQYGGVTITLTHLAPFIRDSFIRYLKRAIYKYHLFKYEYTDNIDEIDDIINRKVWNGYEYIQNKWPDLFEYVMGETKDEITAGVQTFNYQVNSMTNTNGQAPFLSVFMYLDETKEYKVELAMLIEEFLNQRILGIKNEDGVYITPAFPKLLYVLDEDNINEDSEYYYLTELAAKCTAKRMVPDYISAKVMKELKNGDVYPCINKTCA